MVKNKNMVKKIFIMTHVKATFQKVQKIPISNYNLKLYIYYYLFFENIFRKLIKFYLIFYIQNKNFFLLFSEKMFVPESKFALTG